MPETGNGELRPLRWVVAGCAVFAIVYFALDLNRLYALRYGADLGTFLQTLVNLQHGSSWNGAEWRPHFQVHDSWALAALAPLVALAPRAETLIAVQCIAVAAAALPLALLALRLGVPQRAAGVLGAAYLLSPAAQGLAYENFSENVFVPVLAFAGALAAQRRSLFGTLVAAQFLMGVKEDQILFVAWFGAACAIFWDRRLGLSLLGLAVLNGALYWGLAAMHGTPPSDPGYSLHIYNLPGNLTMCVLLLAPFAFAPVAAGRWLLLGLPVLAEIVLAKPWAFDISRIGSHWVAPLLAFTALAAALGLRRSPGFARAMIPCAVIATLFFNDTVLHVGRWPYIVDWNEYARAAALRDTARGVTLSRGDEGEFSVAAANPRVLLERRPYTGSCPAYNTNVRAFFQSLSGAAPRTLCGGVPVSR